MWNELVRHGQLEQETAVRELTARYGGDSTQRWPDGRITVSADILLAFERLSDGNLVYAHWDEAWYRTPRVINEEVHRLATMLAQGDLMGVVSRCKASRLTPGDMATVLGHYGREIAAPPPDAYRSLDAVKVRGAPATWSVRAPLWTREEGKSDLQMQLTMTLKQEGQVEVELDDLRVP